MKSQDFLNPSSMVTPGVAGGIVMLITNSLINQFDLSGPKVALGLSFLVGTLVFLAKTVPFWQRVIYYMLNSLIIFAMATGTAFVGNKTEAKVAGPSIDATSLPAPPSQIRTNDVFTNGMITSVVVTNQGFMVLEESLNMRYPAAGFFKKW
jgi:hypothetical protein